MMVGLPPLSPVGGAGGGGRRCKRKWGGGGVQEQISVMCRRCWGRGRRRWREVQEEVGGRYKRRWGELQEVVGEADALKRSLCAHCALAVPA